MNKIDIQKKLEPSDRRLKICILDYPKDMGKREKTFIIASLHDILEAVDRIATRSEDPEATKAAAISTFAWLLGE